MPEIIGVMARSIDSLYGEYIQAIVVRGDGEDGSLSRRRLRWREASLGSNVPAVNDDDDDTPKHNKNVSPKRKQLVHQHFTQCELVVE